jgi:hypothetical protein
MKLPGDAIIFREKLTHYLLVKRPVGDKSGFLKQAGYTAEEILHVRLLAKAS